MFNILFIGVDYRFGFYGGYLGRNVIILSSVNIDRKLWYL